MMRKTNGKDDFKNILSNLQHQDHRIITTNDTSWLPKFPRIKPLKQLEMIEILKIRGILKIFLKPIVNLI